MFIVARQVWKKVVKRTTLLFKSFGSNVAHSCTFLLPALPKGREWWWENPTRFSHQLSGSPYITILVPGKGWLVQPNRRRLGIFRKITSTCTSCPSKLSLNFLSVNVKSSKRGVLLQWQLRCELMRMSVVSQNEVCQGKFSSTVVYNSRVRLRVRNLTESFFRVFLKK